MPENSIKSFRGVKIRRLNAALMILGCVLAVLIFYTSITIKSKYDEIVFFMNDYSECNKAIYELREASDYLTTQVENFVVNEKLECMNNFFYEVNTMKRRNLAVELLEMTHKDDIADINIGYAFSETKQLEQLDLYIMKLVCSGLHLSPDMIPAEIQAVNLSKEDSVLSEQAMLSKALQILFGSEYSSLQDRVSFYSNCALTYLIKSYVSERNVNDSSIKSIFFQQTLFIVIMFIVCIVLYIVLLELVLFPLFNNLLSIQKGTKMNLKGAYEVRYIATAYNALCDKNMITASLLKHKAEHDPLTGLINRDAFNQIKQALVNSGEPLAYLIIDIDLFKQINDKYGHLKGDEVLKKISSLLQVQFRTTDYVARIGGDEFAVIMTKFGLSPTEIIQKKITDLNKQLQMVDSQMIPVSLSVGVAFSKNGYIKEVEENADKALYCVKRGGRCNCSFYGN